MNRKEIITADLCGRLPHGVKFNEKQLLTAISVERGIKHFYGQISEGSREKAGFMLDHIKPILFNSLTAPITVAGYNDGLAFVPIDELNRLAELNNLDLRVEWDESEDHFIIRVTFFMGGWEMDFVSNWLNQWQVNWRLLPGEYIKATNEYA